MSSLNGKVALVTGGAGGIGSGICEVLAEHGATVIVGYNSSRDEAAALVDRLPNPSAKHAAYAAPVTESAALSELAKKIEGKHGRCDILVNCHGATRFVPAEDLDALDDDLINRMLATNVRGTFATVRALKAFAGPRWQRSRRKHLVHRSENRDRQQHHVLRFEGCGGHADQVAGACARAEGSRRRSVSWPRLDGSREEVRP